MGGENSGEVGWEAEIQGGPVCRGPPVSQTKQLESARQLEFVCLFVCLLFERERERENLKQAPR